MISSSSSSSSTPMRSKALTHTRSSSLPSRSHPLIPQFNHHLQSLCASDSSSLTSVAGNLTNLNRLFDCLDDLLLLNHTRQVFARESGEKWAGQVLDGYLGLVDACATAKDLVSGSKDYLLHLLSLLRRRREPDDLPALLASRKAARRSIQKSLRNVNSLKNKPSVVALDKDEETVAVISMLREAESATLELIESLLLSISGAKSSRWALVSRLIGSRKSLGQDDLGEVDKVVGGFRCDVDLQQLREVEARLGAVEERVENLFKRLIRTRVSLLNMHSRH